MTEQAASELPAQPRRQRHPPVGRIPHHQLETFSLGRLLKTVAHMDDGPQPCPCLAAQVVERRIEENLRHPGGKRVYLEAAQTTLNVVQGALGVAVLQTLRHPPRHRRQECTPATGRVEHPRRTPIDTGFRRHIQEPLAQR